MVIMLTVMVRSLPANSQPDTPHEDPIHTKITFSKFDVFNIFVFFGFFSLEIRVETPLERCAVKNSAFWLLETLNFRSECQVMAKICFEVEKETFRET